MPLVLATACTSRGERAGETLTTTTTTVPPFTYVAVGASETVGVGADDPLTQAWTRIFHQTALPPSTTFVNVGISGATVRQALAQEVPAAVVHKPRLATVWLNVNDLFGLVPVDDYERDLAALVRQLRGGGTTEVLLANTPPLEDLPVVRACLPNPPARVACPLPVAIPGPDVVVSRVAAYNAAIRRVAEREGAVLVDLHRAATQARRDGTYSSYVSADGFHPSTAGHVRIAGVFAEHLRSSPRTRVLAAPGAGGR